MKSCFLICLLFSLSSCVENKLLANFVSQPRVFASVLAKIEPGESKATADDVQTLINTGESEREKATSDLNIAQQALDLALQELNNAIELRSNKEVEIEEAKANANELTSLKASQDADMRSKQEDRVNKDNYVPIIQKKKDDENARIDAEKAFIEKIIAKVGTLSPEPAEEPAEEEPEVTLLNAGFRRLLGNPSLLDIINNANPESIQNLLNLLQKLIDDGEVTRNSVIQEYEDAVLAAQVAASLQEAAEAAFAQTSSALSAALEHIETCEGELVTLQAAEDVADGEHVKATHVRDEFKTIFDQETERIDSELQTYLDAISHLLKLEEIVSLLA